MEKILAAAATACIALLFLIGYLFIYGYYNYFGIGMNELSLSIQDVLVHSFVSLRYSLSSKWLLLLLVLLTIAGSLFMRRNKAFLEFDKLSLIASVLVLGFLVIFSFGATSYGERSARLDSATRPIVVANSDVFEHTQQAFAGSDIWLRHLLSGDRVSHYIVQLKDGSSDRWLVRFSDATIQSLVYLGR